MASTPDLPSVPIAALAAALGVTERRARSFVNGSRVPLTHLAKLALLIGAAAARAATRPRSTSRSGRRPTKKGERRILAAAARILEARKEGELARRIAGLIPCAECNGRRVFDNGSLAIACPACVPCLFCNALPVRPTCPTAAPFPCEANPAFLPSTCGSCGHTYVSIEHGSAALIPCPQCFPIVRAT